MIDGVTRKCPVLRKVRKSRSKNGFTLVECVIIVVVNAILASVAIARYLNLVRDVTDATAKGALGALRAQNALMFNQRVIGGTTATYTMRAIANNMRELKGFNWTAAATRFTMTIRGISYRFTLTPTPRPPTTIGSITAGAGTFITW
jgi:Tfp pilus assembly protein PilE